ncbi:MAG TPA: hypothetical protein VF092_21870 [Longimicrobium sp.]
MERKLSLDPDALAVDSFPTERTAASLNATANRHALGLTLTTCDPNGACHTRNTCTTNLC